MGNELVALLEWALLALLAFESRMGGTAIGEELIRGGGADIFTLALVVIAVVVVVGAACGGGGGGDLVPPLVGVVDR